MEVLAHDQTFFEYENIEGTMVGIYCPPYMSALNAVGWHLHFISDDKTKGGHVLDVNIADAVLTWDDTDGFEVRLPQNEMFAGFDLTIDQSEDIKKAETIVKECVKSGKNITVKIRTGLKNGDDIATDYAIMAEQAGAKLITIHGRVREAYYSGEPDYNAIAKAKKAVSIPVIANGGIYTEEDADKMIENTGADGIMIARGAFSDPFLINKLLKTEPKYTLKEFIIQHLLTLRERYGERRTTLEFRKFIGSYLKGIPYIKENKLALLTSDSTDNIIKILDDTL
jgi:hypothetical protein